MLDDGLAGDLEEWFWDILLNQPPILLVFQLYCITKLKGLNLVPRLGPPTRMMALVLALLLPVLGREGT